MKKLIHSSLVLIILSTLLFTNCGDSSPGCPFCTNELAADPVIPMSEDILGIEMKWCAVAGASSIEDPSLVCEENFRDVLLRRHIRAGSCVWTPQCRIILGTVIGPTNNYGLMVDQDTDLGEPGDMVINENTSMTQEMIDMIVACDNHWNSKPSGLTAISIRRFIWPSGNPSAIKGIGSSNSGTRPFLMVVDPEFLPNQQKDVHQSTEQVLAHEIGHALGLCHSNDEGCNDGGNGDLTDNLMLTPGNARNRILLESQCDIARSAVPSVFTRQSQKVHLDFVMNDRSAGQSSKATDLYKVVVADEAEEGGGLKILLGTNGLFNNRGSEYWVALDTDNQTTTGLNTQDLIPNGNQAGVELAIQVVVNGQGKVSAVNLHKAGTGAFEPIQNARIKAKAKTIDIFAYSDDACTSTPAFEEIELTIAPQAFESLGLPTNRAKLFNRGLKMQAVSGTVDENGTNVYDRCPNRARTLKFKKNTFSVDELKE